jgi:hypothetical protein
MLNTEDMGIASLVNILGGGHMLHILIHIDDKLGGIGWVKNV